MGFQIENGVLKKYTEEPGVTEVIIPEGVTSIGEGAFRGCKGLMSIIIPEGVTNIDDEAFIWCTSLTNISIPESVTSIGKTVFYNCFSMTDISIPEGVSSIAEETFSGCLSLASIVIPKNVISIGAEAFFGCSNLTHINIPSGLTNIGERAFTGCKSLADPDGFVIVNKNLICYYGTKKDVEVPTRVTSIGDNAFSGCNMKSITIPASVTSIGYDAFSDCKYLTSVTIPESVTSIGAYAFSGCKCLVHVNLPEGLTRIEESMFSGCKKLKSVSIPLSVTKIDKDAFKGCVLSEINISVTTLLTIKDLDIWAGAIKSLPWEGFLMAIKKCPKKLIPDAEKRMMASGDIAAIRYFEQQNRLNEYAAFHNTDADSLRDSILSDFGLDEKCCKSWPLAGSVVTARMEKNLTVTLLDAQGKVLKSIPKKGADPAEYDTAKKEFAQLKKDIPAAAKLRNNRLLADFLEARPRSAERWKATYLRNPLLKALAKLVVWQQGANTFILNETGTPVDAAGNDAALSDEPILLAHPMEMGAETTKAWQDYFLNHHLSQPFAQVWEPVLDGSTIRRDRYEGATIPLHMLMNKDFHGITMDGQSKLKLQDCTAGLKLIEGHHDWVNNEFEISDFRFEKFTRAVNHIAAHFDKGTVQGRLLKDDASAAQWLDYFTLAQITEFINLVTEKGDCPNSAAALLEYKNAKYPDADPFAEFVLDL